MRNQRPFASILLPVFNGEKYLDTVVKTVLNQNDQDFELIISIDNSTDSSANIARKYEQKFDKIKVFTHLNRLGMRNNYDFLLSKANGSWITVLGQDDALMPFAISQLRQATFEIEDLEVFVSRRAYAYWPDTEGRNGRFHFIYPFFNRQITKVNSEKFLASCLKGTKQYLEGPQLYSGSFVSKKLIDAIVKNQNGETFPYPIPDVSSSASILLSTSHFYYLDLPLFIIGTSGGSTGVLIEKEIDKSIIEKTVSNVYTEAFSGKVKNIDVPGYGIFTSFSWYLFEATSLVLGKNFRIFEKINPSWIFASLLHQTPKKRKQQLIFKKVFSAKRQEYKINYFSIKIKEFSIRMRAAFNFSLKFYRGFNLLLTNKLVLENKSIKFDLLKFIDEASHKVEKKLKIQFKYVGD